MHTQLICDNTLSYFQKDLHYIWKMKTHKYDRKTSVHALRAHVMLLKHKTINYSFLLELSQLTR